MADVDLSKYGTVSQAPLDLSKYGVISDSKKPSEWEKFKTGVGEGLTAPFRALAHPLDTLNAMLPHGDVPGVGPKSRGFITETAAGLADPETRSQTAGSIVGGLPYVAAGEVLPPVVRAVGKSGGKVSEVLGRVAENPTIRKEAANMVPGIDKIRAGSRLLDAFREIFQKRQLDMAAAPLGPPQAPVPAVAAVPPAQSRAPIVPPIRSQGVPTPAPVGPGAGPLRPPLATPPPTPAAALAQELTGSPEGGTIPARKMMPAEAFKEQARATRAGKVEVLAKHLNEAGIAAEDVARIPKVKWRDISDALGIELPKELAATTRDVQTALKELQKVKKTAPVVFMPSTEGLKSLQKPGAMEAARKFAEAMDQ